MKNCAIINDLSAFGRCSLGVNIPIISSLGIQCNSIPTAILTNQTGFEHFHKIVLDDSIKNAINDFEKYDYHFDGIVTGYLASLDQYDDVSKFIEKFSNDETVVAIDPVMADDGSLYKGFNDVNVEKYRELIHKATIITPNITEFELLTETHFSSCEEVINSAIELLTGKLKYIIITGIVQEDKVTNIVIEKNGYKQFSSEYNGISYSGTGDIFTTVVTGCLINGKDIYQSVETAKCFIDRCIKDTYSKNKNFGILFEKHLGELDDEQ